MNDQSKSFMQINLIKLVGDLFTKLQKRIDNLRAGYIELNELHELLTQSYEILIEKLTKKDGSDGKLLHQGSVKKEVIRSDGLMPIGSSRSSESQDDDDEESISIVLDDVMQYFDFLDDAENSSSELMDVAADRISVKLVKEINVDALPSDFNHFLIRHFSHCIKLLDVSDFVIEKILDMGK